MTWTGDWLLHNTHYERKVTQLVETHHIEGGKYGLVQQLTVAGLAAWLLLGKLTLPTGHCVGSGITLNQHLHPVQQYKISPERF